MTKDEALKLALEALEAVYIQGDVECVATPDGTIYLRPTIAAIKEALAQPEQESASIIQAVTDPENQPSQYGTVTLDYHLAKLKEWENRFEKLSNRVLAQPEERNFCSRCGKRTADLTTIHTCTPPQENT